MKTFYLKQKILAIADKYNIYDESNNLVYYCKSQLITLTSKLYLIDNNTEKEVYFISRKLLTILPKYTLHKNNEVIASVNKHLTLFAHALTVDSKLGVMKVEGSIVAHNFTITLYGRLVCEVKKAWFTLGDAYSISIYDEVNYELYIALVIMIDNCIHNGNNK